MFEMFFGLSELPCPKFKYINTFQKTLLTRQIYSNIEYVIRNNDKICKIKQNTILSVTPLWHETYIIIIIHHTHCSAAFLDKCEKTRSFNLYFRGFCHWRIIRVIIIRLC